MQFQSAELKINTENLKKQELLLHQENKDINQKIDLARKKLLEEKAIQVNNFRFYFKETNTIFML